MSKNFLLPLIFLRTSENVRSCWQNVEEIKIEPHGKPTDGLQR